MVIDVRNVSKHFGGLTAVNNCSLSVKRGSITGLIGPNGAGKSTLFNMVAGNIVPDEGQVIFDGEDVTGLPPHRLFRIGMLRTFQIAHEFSQMTALENLMMVPGDQPGEHLIETWLRPGLVKSRETEVRKKALDVIDFLKLGHVRDELAGNLSGGQKKLLELGRTMMVDAKAVLLDEVAAGVNKTLLNDLASNIERMNQELGYTFFVIEHDMDLIGRLCDPVIVMAQGEKIAEGPMAEIRANPAIVEAYFGTPVEGA
ncbi:branched-chain amino acid transport system ATP-binding protein [Devosia subaequoris]|uniref:Branched-chain amino acid transport system ATP-binding protein n=1 Tax=Devosia subaequoris TaxID=395930 RepID=A0A7W6ND48_9HYPH|nr:ABC transporter ATP-binding protein [Devosia subaequoris]MBB4053429.1 branched-chain amino acid transport system ATP-binding protein [Devosia subaequoris]